MFYNYNDAVKLLTSSDKFRISLGLERMEKIMNILGNPQDKLKCIHVAGTNGKGSVCAIIASILNEAGKKVGIYSSPHIFKYTERIKICGKEIPDEDFSRYVFEISQLADKNNIALTEFEILTAVMFKYFYDNNVEVVVLETGLGGRYDATNIIKTNLCSVITHIDYDHTERLGKTLDEISVEKAGIIKSDSLCIVLEGRETFYDKAMDVGASLEIINPFVQKEYIDALFLKGEYQRENLALALAVTEKCFPQITPDNILNGLKNVNHPFRFQYFKNKNLIIDGAHNPNGISVLKNSLDTYYPDIKRRFIFGCLRNKDYNKMLNLLLNENDEIYFYHFKHKNSATFDELKTVCPVYCRELTKDAKINFNDGHLNIICGSFYMIGELIKLLNISQDNL